jgi:hypothetical protein
MALSSFNAEKPRRTYERPALSELGSLKELTLGNGSQSPDAMGNKTP